MQLLDPPSQAFRNGMAADELVDSVNGDIGALEEMLSEQPIEDLLNGGDADENTWRAQALDCLANGSEVPSYVRAGAYLENSRVMALLNETAERMRIDLDNAEAGLAHVTNWCSFQMREQLEMVFPSTGELKRYLASVQEMTAGSWLGYSPESAIGRTAARV
jgi:hypothetical protein